MRIAQIAHSLSARTDGVVVALRNISKELARRGHEVVIYASDVDPNPEFIDSLPEVKIYTFTAFLDVAGFYPSVGMLGQLRTEIQHFDIVHMHNFRTFQNIAGHYYAQKHEVPYVLQAHGSVLRIVEKHRPKKVFDQVWGHRLLRDASRVIAVSPTEVEQYQEMGVSEDKIAMIPNGLELQSFTVPVRQGAFREKHGIKEKHIVLYLGRIHRRKGVDFLIKAFAALVGAVEDVILVVAGPDDGYQPQMEKLVQKLGLDSKVRFVGPVSREARVETYADASVFVYPSVHEIFGFPPFEAILCGTPVIVTNDCGCGELIEKAHAGQLVRYGDIPGLKQLLREVLENPQQHAEAAARGRRYVLRNLTWSNVVGQMEKLYYDVIGSEPFRDGSPGGVS